MKPPRPILWVGAKTEALPLLVPLLQGAVSAAGPGVAYAEPFLGGGTVAQALRATLGLSCCPLWLGDLNPHLINAWSWMTDPDLPKTVATFSTLTFDSMVNLHNQARRKKVTALDVEDAAVFLLVNRLCFNGLYRVNSSGVFNVPPGYRNKKKGKNVDALLKSIDEARVAQIGHPPPHLLVGDYARVMREIMQRTKNAPLVGYFDPPFMDTFDNYEEGSTASPAWTACLFRALDRLQLSPGSTLVVSNSEAARPMVPRGWSVQVHERSGRMNSKTSAREKVREIIAIKRIP